MKNLFTLLCFSIPLQVIMSQTVTINNSGNVGIGFSDPHAPLHLSSATAMRKIVLGEVNNNHHEFYGFGNEIFRLRYQVPSTTHAHIFYAATSSSSSQQLMAINGNGLVGIGFDHENQVQNLLDIQQADRTGGGGAHASNRPLYVTGDIGASSNGIEFRHTNGEFGIGFGYNTIYAAGFWANHDLGLMAKGTGKLKFSTNGTEQVWITPEGELGIDVAEPNELFELGGDGRAFFGNGGGTARKGLLIDGLEGSNASRIEAYDYGTNTGRNLILNSTGKGHVGIGLVSPHAPLQLSDTLANRKVVLVEESNNNHRFYGFGVNIDIMRYQVPEINDSHVFYAGTSTDASTELMRITGNGYVGIGQPYPVAPLQFANNELNRKIVLWHGPNNDHEFSGFGINNSVLRYQVPSTGTNHVFYAGVSPSESNELMRIQGDGRLGLGVPYAENKFDVNAGTEREGSHAVDLPMYVTGGIGSDANGIEFRHYNGSQGLGFGYNTIYAAGSAPSQELGFKAKGPNGFLKFTTNGAERLRINENGHVGIGTSTPHAPLQFANGNAHRKIVLSENQNDNHQFYGLGIDNNILRYQLPNTTANHIFYAAANSSSSHEIFRITGTGYVKIPMGDNRQVVLQQTASDQHQFTGFGRDISNLRYQVSSTSVAHIFFAGVSPSSSAELMRIQGNGNVGIGLNNPAYKLHVGGDGHFTGDVSAQNGDFNGNVFASCGMLTCSDIRYKINIKPVTNALQNIKALQGITYDWDKEKFPEKQFNDRRQIGVSAQELEKIYPEMVFTDDKGYKTVDYSRLTPVLIEAVKELNQENMQLNERLSTQEKMILQLLTQVTALEEKMNTR